jgi:outer membrane protein assembly factor BamB
MSSLWLSCIFLLAVLVATVWAETTSNVSWPEEGYDIERDSSTALVGPTTSVFTTSLYQNGNEFYTNAFTASVIDSLNNLYFASSSAMYKLTYQGELKWKHVFANYYFYTTALYAPVLSEDESTVFLTIGNNSMVIAWHTSTGNIKWKYSTASNVYVYSTYNYPPVVDKANNLFVSLRGDFFCLNAITGQLVWRKTSVEPNGVAVVNNGKVSYTNNSFNSTIHEYLVLNYDTDLYAYNVSGGILWKQCVFCHLQVPTGYSDWAMPSMTSPTVSSKKKLIFLLASASGTNSYTKYSPTMIRMAVFDLKSGDFQYSLPLGESTCNISFASSGFSTKSFVSLSSDGNTAYVPYIEAYYSRVFSSSVCDHKLFFSAIDVTSRSYLYNISMSAKISYTSYLSYSYTTPIVSQDRIIYISMGNNISALDAATGSLIWNQHVATAPLSQGSLGLYGALYYTAGGFIQLFTPCGENSVVSKDGKTCTPCDQIVWEENLSGTTDKFYKSAVENHYCQAYCAMGYYQSTPETSLECALCEFPFTNNKDGSTDCSLFCLCWTTDIVIAVVVSMIGIFLVSLFFSKTNRLVLLMILTFPTIDVFSDIAYLGTNKFYHIAIFALGVASFCSTGMIFLFRITKSGLVFKSPLLIWRDPPFPLLPDCLKRAVNDKHETIETDSKLEADSVHKDTDNIVLETTQPPLKRTFCENLNVVRKQYAFFKEHPELHFWILEVIYVVLVIIPLMLLWLFTKLGLLLVVFLSLPLMFLWLLLGVFFHMTKAFCIGSIWNFWHRVWLGGSEEYSTSISFDTAELNEGLFQEFLLESLPQFILQVVNNTLLHEWTAIGIISTTVSIYMALNGFYKFLYFQRVRKMKFEDIPVSIPFMNRYKIEPNSKASRGSESKQDTPVVTLINEQDNA